jgi:hypothetical protein
MRTTLSRTDRQVRRLASSQSSAAIAAFRVRHLGQAVRSRLVPQGFGWRRTEVSTCCGGFMPQGCQLRFTQFVADVGHSFANFGIQRVIDGFDRQFRQPFFQLDDLRRSSCFSVGLGTVTRQPQRLGQLVPGLMIRRLAFQNQTEGGDSSLGSAGIKFHPPP